MHPLKRLQQLLSPNARQQGTVIRATNNAILVATTQGPMTLNRMSHDGTVYRPGDRLALQDGRILGKLRARSNSYAV